jgi:hypothetical protein
MPTPPKIGWACLEMTQEEAEAFGTRLCGLAKDAVVEE